MGSNRSAYCLCLPIIAIFIFSLPTFSICGEIRVDGTACTLAEAISSANNDDADGNGCADGGGDDIIMLEQDIILTTALPDITSTVTIEGKGYTIDGNNDQDIGSVLRFTCNGPAYAPDHTLTINETTVTGGNSTGPGGGIYTSSYGNSCSITLNSSVVSGNTASSGGGIYCSGDFGLYPSLTLNSSTIIGNTASSNGGGMYIYPEMFSSYSVTLDNSTVSGNTGKNGGGIGHSIGSFSLTLTNSTVSGNTADDAGGGIYSEPYEASAGIILDNSTVGGNTAANGGGIYSNPGPEAPVSLILNSSVVSENLAFSDGGGIYFSGSPSSCGVNCHSAVLNSSTVAGNTASSDGGGIYQTARAYYYIGVDLTYSSLTLNNSTVSGNTAENGGGIYNKSSVDNDLVPLTASSSVTLRNSTVSRNTASLHGGAIYNTLDFFDNGMNHTLISSITLISSLVSGNTAAAGNEIKNDEGGILAADSFNLFGHSGETDVQAFSGFIPGSADINATSDGTNTPLSSILDTTLSDNGGLTKTHALVQISPAVDLDADCTAGLTEDQRGYSRPSGVGCDAGSFELENSLSRRNVMPWLYLLLNMK